ncbi:hypothetical protein IFR05_014393 [Cadophora sp. M221]|nr:hypothetical protein IFR05_014393 [Cadophora sp. M221]
MLYQYNTFRVTRLVAQANNDWADFCTGPPKKGSDPDMNLLDDFLKSKVRLFRTPGASRTTRVGRSCMIKKLIIEDSDLDSDYYSKRGIAKFPPLMCPIDKQRFVFYIINKFFRFGGKLRELTITMDEEEPGILGQLTFEGEVVSLIERAAEGSDDKEAVRERWANFMASSRQTEVWTKNWHFKDEEVMAMTAAVEYVIVRGTGASGGDLKFRYFRGRTTRRDRGIHVSGNYAPTSKVAKCLLKYFKTCREKGLLRYFPVLSFTGKFDQRRLRDDGTWVSDDNLDDWLAKRAQPALEITDEDGKEGDGLPYYL